MNAWYTENQETVRYFDKLYICCRDFSDQNFDKIRCLIRLPCHVTPIAIRKADHSACST